MAQKAERESIELKKAEYMQDKIGIFYIEELSDLFFGLW